MSEMQQLVELLQASSPELVLKMDCSEAPDQSSWLDIEQRGRFVAVEWRPGRGFGVSLVNTADDPHAGLFEGPDEILPDPFSARDWILFLLQPVTRRKAAGR